MSKRQRDIDDTSTHQDFFASATFNGIIVSRKASCACGGGCPACSKGEAGNLKISHPTDAVEIEADRLADQVMRMPSGDSSDPVHTQTTLHNHVETDEVHRKCSACEEEELEEPLMRKEASVSAEPPPETPPASGDKPPSINQVINSGGTQLDHVTRGFFEPRFGIDLGHVRIHTGQDAALSARSINARAYTLGSNIVFGGSQYHPADKSGKHLLAHELAHVAQQTPPTVINRLHAKPLPATQVNTSMIHRAPDDLDDLFEPPSGDSDTQEKDAGGTSSADCPRVPTKLGDVEPEPSCPKATHIGTNEVARFNFCLDSDQLISPGDLSQLAGIVSGNHAKTRYIVHGYASPEGKVNYNFRLACHRANRVAKALHDPIRAQVRTRLGSAGEDRIRAEGEVEILGRIETAAQGPTSAFGKPEENRLVIVYAQIPGAKADEEPSCEDAHRGMGNITPEILPDLPTVDLTVMKTGRHMTHFHFCTDSDIFNGVTPVDVRKFAHAQASKASFVVHGFASEEGGAEYNRRLSHHRALRVARELMNAGARPEQIREVSAMGETNKFGDKEFNRVAIVLAEGGEVGEFDDTKREANSDSQKAAILDEAKQRVISGQYNLAADAYISFWTCGRTRTVGQAIERLTIALPRNNEDEFLRDAANGTEEGFGVNFVRVSNVALRADNPIECTMGRLIDMSFHHSVLGNPDLPGDLTRRFDPTARSEDPINDPKNKEPRHQAGLHLIHLAGLEACEGRRATPDIGPRDEPVGIDKPVEKDPRAGRRPPGCAEAPQPTRLHFPVEGTKGREAPFFNLLSSAYAPATGKLTNNFESDAERKSQNLITRPEKDILTASAEVQLVGNPDFFSDYEVGFIQAVLDDETEVEYDSGHRVIQALPVPIRHAAMKGDIPVPAPWTTLDSMARPDSTGKVTLTTSGIGLNSEVSIRLRQLNRQLPKAAIAGLEQGTRIAIWLVARRLGAPLDRFSVHFIDGAEYDLIQLCHLEHRRIRGELNLPENLGGERELPLFRGGFHVSKPSILPADPGLARFGGAVASDIGLFNQVRRIIDPASADETGLSLPEFTKEVADILDNLVLFESEEDARANKSGTKTPRLGFDFIPLTISLPMVRATGRLETPDEQEIIVKVAGNGLGENAAKELARALQFRIHNRSFQGSDVVVRPSIIPGSGEIGNVIVKLQPLPRDPTAPAEQESDLTKRADVLENMAEAWACTELTKTPKFIMVGAREFARAFSMDRDKKITPVPADRLVMGEESLGESFTTKMPCPRDPDGVNLGSFHTHPEPDPIPPVPSQADKDYVEGCGGGQHFIVTDNRVFRVAPDGKTTTPVNVTLPKAAGCHAINLEEIQVKGDDEEF